MEDLELGGWKAAADAWIERQGELGDVARRDVLDPCLDHVLGSVEGLEVLDVGCGEGRYARKLALRGAVVTGIDPVALFIDHAKKRHPEGQYLVAPAESIPLESDAFDLTLSYLTIVDIPDYRSAIKEMARATKPDGRVVVVTVSNMASTSTGWVKDDSGRKLFRAVDRYMEEFAMELEWFGATVINYHRPTSAILNEFFKAGMVMDGFWEPLPAPDSPDYADEFRAPNFQVMSFCFKRP